MSSVVFYQIQVTERQSYKRSLYREIVEAPLGIILCTCGVIARRALACSCVLIVLEQQYGIYTRSCSVALKAYTLVRLTLSAIARHIMRDRSPTSVLVQQ